jgi:hypothetical protein
MKTPTTANRIAALVRYINAIDVRQGRPANVADRKALPNDLNVRLSPDCYGDRVFVADIDNHALNHPFAVLTMDEAATAKEITLERDLTDDDCVEHRGVTYVVVSLA